MNKLFNDKRLKYGTYSTVVALVVIGILIAVNLVVSEFDYKFDLTGEEIFSLSDETKEVLNNVNEDITIYTLFNTKNNDNVVSMADEVLEQYRQNNKHIRVENKDLYLYPDFAGQYSTEDNPVSANGMIVQKGERYKVISYNEYLYNNAYLNVESLVTSAIQYVCMTENPVIYYVTGHNEEDYNNFTSVLSGLKSVNYELEGISLLDKDIPEDCTALMITDCARDYSENEAQKVKDYLANDGRALFVISEVSKADKPNLASIVSNYGVELSDSFIIEGDESAYYQYPFALLPNVENHDVNSNLLRGGYRVWAYSAKAITEVDIKKQGLVIEPLLTTTNKSFIKADGNQSFNQETGDPQGPFNVAVAVTDSTYTDTSHTTKAVVCSSAAMLYPDVDSYVSGANSGFILGAVNWLNDDDSSLYIAPKSLQSESTLIDNAQRNKIMLLSVYVLPGILFILGAVVWVRRRNK